MENKVEPGTIAGHEMKILKPETKHMFMIRSRPHPGVFIENKKVSSQPTDLVAPGCI